MFKLDLNPTYFIIMVPYNCICKKRVKKMSYPTSNDSKEKMDNCMSPNSLKCPIYRAKQ